MSERTVSYTSFRDLIEQVAGIVDSDRKISNKELIEICKGCRGFDFNVDAHIYHEIAETALNQLILTKYGRDLLASTDPIEAVSTVLRPLQKRLPTQTWRSETQIAYQQFSTPVTIAYLAAYLLNLKQGETVLEPSCGTGSLAVWASAIGVKVIANEIDPRRRGSALALGFHPYSFDAEFIDDLLPEHLLPDIVLANPPFSSTGGRVKNNSLDFGFRHIESALRRLKKGGRFAVILGESGSPRSHSGNRFWEYLSPEIQVKASVELLGREFYSNGTSVKTTLILGTKSSAIDTPLSSQLEAAPHMVAQSIEDAFEQSISLNLRF
ncbi:MAG: SAM-dependent DNA methyltransferase [Acidobacteria bacterium]|nr:SAM-dependent DNA methyltransferase [Acidobacteriota bacterium]